MEIVDELMMVAARAMHAKCKDPQRQSEAMVALMASFVYTLCPERSLGDKMTEAVVSDFRLTVQKMYEHDPRNQRLDS